MSNIIPGNSKHLTLSDRSYIESAICKGESFINISKYLCKDPSTIGREVLKHRILDNSHYKNRLNNYCAKRFDCKKTHVCLKCDRGFEFTHPKELEYGINKLKRTKIFYCNSMSAYQKGRLEKNHEYIRKFFPKGSSFDNLTQDDINLMLSHINSSKRQILGNKSPLEVFLGKQNDLILELLDIKQIEPDKVILNKNLFPTK